MRTNTDGRHATDKKIQDRNEGFSNARRHFDDARSLIQLAERVDDWDDNVVPALIRAAGNEIDEASAWFYSERGDDQGGAS